MNLFIFIEKMTPLIHNIFSVKKQGYRLTNIIRFVKKLFQRNSLFYLTSRWENVLIPLAMNLLIFIEKMTKFIPNMFSVKKQGYRLIKIEKIVKKLFQQKSLFYLTSR